MNSQSEFDRIARNWLADGPTELSDRVVDAALAEIQLTRQRRRVTAPWRTHQMPAFTRVAVAGAAVLALVIATVLWSRAPDTRVGGPSSASTPSPVAETPSQQTTVTFSDTGCTVTGVEALSKPAAYGAQIDFVSQRPQYVVIDLWRIGQGKTYTDLANDVAIDQGRIAQGLPLSGAGAVRGGTAYPYLTQDTGEILESPATESRFATLPPGTHAFTCLAFADYQGFAEERALALFVVGPIEIAPKP